MTVANKKISIILLLVAFALVSLLVIATNKGVPDDSESTNFTEIEQYFIEQITAQTLDRIEFQPIEGLEKSMYLEAYPGLRSSDFVDVEILGDTNPGDVKTSADAMVTDRGLVTLMDNISDRLGVAVEAPGDIDALLVTVSQSTSAQNTNTATSSVPFDDEGGDIAASCISSGGNWIAEYGECEHASQEWCADAGGEFDACTSACRNDSDAEICTMQCVPVCAFADTE